MTYVNNLTYNATGQITGLTYGSGVVRTHTYHPTTLRLATLQTVKDSPRFQDLSYPDYDNVGNLRTLVDNNNQSNNQTFTYDALDRLFEGHGPYGTHGHTYSPIGNFLTKAGVTYNYGATAQTCGRLMPHAVTATSDGKSYAYDCNGNTLSDGERTFTWDADNKPVSITRTGVGTTTFAYSGDGARVRKQGPSQVIRYVGGFEDHATDAVQVKHIAVGGLRIATKVSGGPNTGTYFTHGDHLGSLNVLTNSQGTEVQRLTYLPFGETYTNQGSKDFDRQRFTGQTEDPETGLYFYNARYYNPALGRFISPDPIVPGPSNPQSLNRYSYVENNPVNRIDPSGHFSFGGFFKSLLSVAAGIIVGVATGGMGAPAVVAGMLGGAAAGAVNTALNGGNLGTNILAGAAFGGLAGGIGPPLAAGLGGGLQGAMGSGAILGAAFGGIGAAAAGKNVLTGMLAGAVSGALLAAAVYGGYQAWASSESPAIGGKESCDNCQPPNVAPSGNTPAYSYDYLFEGGARITSPYGSRYFQGSWEIHPGLDVQPQSGGYGTELLAPGRVVIGGSGSLSGYGDYLTYQPEGTDITAFHGHTMLLPRLEPGMVVNQGTPIGILTNTGRTFGPHTHIEIHQGGIRYDPSTIFR